MQRIIIRLAGTGTVACLGLLGAAAAPASAAPGQTSSAAGFTFGVPGIPVPISGPCPFGNGDAVSFVVTSGTMTNHGVMNKNGSWGGQTVEGTTTLSVAGSTYTGHMTYWNGGGTNVVGTEVGQSEGGLTLDFHGSGSAGNVDVHLNGHMTVNNNGTTTVDNTPGGNGLNGAVTCS
jgi:hypothetical protein